MLQENLISFRLPNKKKQQTKQANKKLKKKQQILH